jgi:hypothetical protein
MKEEARKEKAKRLSARQLDENSLRMAGVDIPRASKLMNTKTTSQGKASMTPVGNVKDSWIPIYREDIDMIKKAAPIASRLMKKIEANKNRVPDTVDDLVRPEDLNTGPDTTENINEVDLQQEERVKKFCEEIKKIRELRNAAPAYIPDDVVSDIEEVTFDMRDHVKEFPGAGKKCPHALMELERNKNVSPGDKPADYYTYGRILERMDDTHRKKNSDYGDAAYKGYKKFGDYYFMVQLHNKYQRLESLTIGNKTQQVNDESIDDTLLDMANYAVMYLESRHRND